MEYTASFTTEQNIFTETSRPISFLFHYFSAHLLQKMPKSIEFIHRHITNKRDHEGAIILYELFPYFLSAHSEFTAYGFLACF